MAVKKKAPINVAGLKASALDAALKALRSEAVREQLKRAPAAVLKWASDHHAKGRDKGTSDGSAGANLADRFGQRGLERRINHFSNSIVEAFGDREHTSRPELWAAMDELKKSIKVAGGLPLVKRKRMHMRIDDHLDQLENGLMDALQPKL